MYKYIILAPILEVKDLEKNNYLTLTFDLGN